MRIYHTIMPVVYGLLLFIMLSFSWQGVAVAMQPNKPLVFAVFAYLEEAQVVAEYQPVIDYLNKTMKEGSVELQVLSAVQLDEAVRDHKVDIVTTNPTQFLQLRYQYKLTGALATKVGKSDNQYTSTLAGVIVTKKNRKDINRLSDIQGKTIAITSKQHMGGYRAQAYEFVKAGVHLKDEQLVVVGSHYGAVEAVLSGKADVGFARIGILEKMEAEGRLGKDALKVINAKYTLVFRNKISTEVL